MAPRLDAATKNASGALTELGLVDPGYSFSSQGEPFIWLINGNGERVLQNIEKTFSSKLKILPRARTALYSLEDSDREAVIASVESLLARGPETWTGDEATRLEESLYLVRVTPELRAFVAIFQDGRAELADIAREETIRKFLERSRNGSKAG